MWVDFSSRTPTSTIAEVSQSPQNHLPDSESVSHGHHIHFSHKILHQMATKSTVKQFLLHTNTRYKISTSKWWDSSTWLTTNDYSQATFYPKFSSKVPPTPWGDTCMFEVTLETYPSSRFSHKNYSLSSSEGHQSSPQGWSGYLTQKMWLLKGLKEWNKYRLYIYRWYSQYYSKWWDSSTWLNTNGLLPGCMTM